jgi:hypothetical protein
MKLWTGFAVMAILLFIFSSNLIAWTIDINNTTAYKAHIQIIGYSCILEPERGECGETEKNYVVEVPPQTTIFYDIPYEKCPRLAFYSFSRGKIQWSDIQHPLLARCEQMKNTKIHISIVGDCRNFDCVRVIWSR